MTDIISIIQAMTKFFLLIAVLFQGSIKNCVFANSIASKQPSKMTLTDLAIEKLNPCERAVWR